MSTRMGRWILVCGFAALSLAACSKPASKAPAQPQPREEPLSAAGHDEKAADYEEQARIVEKKYNPHAMLNGGMCRGRPDPTEDVCWTSMVNPTEKYRRHAEEHRRLAAEHRAAAKTLREAEVRTCMGISPADRDESLFDHVEDIARVEPLHGGVSRYLKEPWTEGVVVTFKPVAGMSVAWLQRVVDCQLARNAVLGNYLPEFEQCLLVPRGVRATVEQVADGFAVTVRAGDRATAEDLLHRADLLSTAVRARAAQPEARPEPEAPPAPEAPADGGVPATP
jgi:hypothetical protein